MKILFAAGLCTVAVWAQQSDAEQEALQKALAEAGNSQVDFIYAIERHLEKYPVTEKRPELERALTRAAAELKDGRRVILYGERTLTRDSMSAELLERVSRYLLADDDRDHAKRARGYAKRLEDIVKLTVNPLPGMRGAARVAEERAILLGKAFVYQSRAAGNLGEFAEAEKLARSSYAEFPTAEAAREIARWLDKQGKADAAIAALADAFMIQDPNSESSDRARDRARLGEWYKKAKGSEQGLGDLLLAAYDRTQGKVDDYRATVKKWDPNAEATTPIEFTLTGLKGDKLVMASLKGKVVVLDFWATWCGPCRAQQPLYEEVQRRFKDNSGVVFLNINTDENREVVKPFLEREKWGKVVYFEDGMSGALRVSSIPTTMILNKKGEIASRMNGYIADRFVDMLSDRITRLLAEK
ncbi:MAG: TlpA disulfide reductase family protein [Bryobacteraceae bacterium]